MHLGLGEADTFKPSSILFIKTEKIEFIRKVEGTMPLQMKEVIKSKLIGLRSK